MATVWLYNSDSGKIDSVTTTLGLDWFALHSGIGWHGPFNTKQEALDFYNQNKNANPGWKAPTESNAVGAANALGADSLAKTIDNQGLQNALQEWFLRIGEVILGVVLIAVGVAKLTGASNVISRVVDKVPL